MKVYHGTTTDFASLIKSYGLDPEHARGFRRWDDAFYKGIRGTSIYVTTDLKQAQSWAFSAAKRAGGGTKREPHPMVVMVEVRDEWARKNFLNDRTDGPGNYLVRAKIIPQWITSFAVSDLPNEHDT